MADLSQHYAIEALRGKATRLFAELDQQLERTRKELAEASTEEAKKTYNHDHLRMKAEAIKQRAKDFASLQTSELRNISSRLDITRKTWDTGNMIRRARFVPESDRIESELLEELKRMRFASDVRDMTAAELVETTQEAVAAKNLALLGMLNKEASRRMYETDTERATVKVTLQKALAEVQPDGQADALKLIEETALTLTAAEDAIIEMQSGKEPERARMRRIVAKQANHDDA